MKTKALAAGLAPGSGNTAWFRGEHVTGVHSAGKVLVMMKGAEDHDLSTWARDASLPLFPINVG
jgi:hypothetical protein